MITRTQPVVILTRFCRAILATQPKPPKAAKPRDVLGVFLGGAVAIEAEHGSTSPITRVFRQALPDVKARGIVAIREIAQEDDE